MPLEDLLAMYGYEASSASHKSVPPAVSHNHNSKQPETTSSSAGHNQGTSAAPVAVGESSSSDTSGSLEHPASGQTNSSLNHEISTSTSANNTSSGSGGPLHIPEAHWRLPSDAGGSGGASSASHVTRVGPAEDDSEEWDDGDEDDEEWNYGDEGLESDGDEPADWRRTIQVGTDFQAVVPDGLSCYDGVPAYENEDRILWDPATLNDLNVEEYLRRVKETSPDSGSPPEVSGLNPMPELTLASDDMIIRDDEQALYLLLQCGYKSDEALRRRKMQPQKNTSMFESMTPWSEEECRNFEEGLRLFSKDFHAIQKNKVYPF